MKIVEFQVLATTEKILFWNVAKCSLVETDRCFRGVYCLYHQGALVTEAVSTSETSVNLYETALMTSQNSHLFSKFALDVPFHHKVN
jgi:hypothetical protein